MRFCKCFFLVFSGFSCFFWLSGFLFCKCCSLPCAFANVFFLFFLAFLAFSGFPAFFFANVAHSHALLQMFFSCFFWLFLLFLAFRLSFLQMLLTPMRFCKCFFLAFSGFSGFFWLSGFL